jgi:hypothetical protein
MSPETGLRWLLEWLFRGEGRLTADRTAKTVNNARRADEAVVVEEEDRVA